VRRARVDERAVDYKAWRAEVTIELSAEDTAGLRTTL
jgi:hypothetical protein